MARLQPLEAIELDLLLFHQRLGTFLAEYRDLETKVSVLTAENITLRNRADAVVVSIKGTQDAWIALRKRNVELEEIVKELRA